jgi:hypothetical protein
VGTDRPGSAEAAGEAVLARAVAAYQAALGPRLLAGYALGSLAHGGFSPLVSDVDLGLILAGPLRAADRLTIGTVARRLRAGGSDLQRRLSVFWGSPATLRGTARGGRFPPLDRLDLLENGRLLAGADARDGMARPGQAELLIAGAEFAIGYLGGRIGWRARLSPWSGLSPRTRLRSRDDTVLAQIRDPRRLVASGPRQLTKVVLFPARFLLTAATGRVGTNGLAAEHYLDGGPAPAAALVAAALAWRDEPPEPAAAITLLDRELIPLYVQFLDDHVARLQAAGQPRLAAGMSRWRARLLA